MDDRSRHRLVGACLGVLVCTLGAIVLAGWYLHAPILVQLNPSWVPMQYNTALSFVALGSGLVALACGIRQGASLLGIVPLVVGSITLVTWIFDLHPGIDEVFFRHYITIFTPSPGRMSPNAAFGFVLAGAAVVLAGIRPQAPDIVLARTVGLFVAVYGAAAGFWTLLQAGGSPTETVRFTLMAVHTGIGFVLCGASIAVLTWRPGVSSPEVDRLWELPVAGGLSIVIVSLVLWQALATAESRRMRDDTQDHAKQIAAVLEADGRRRMESFVRTARRAARHGESITEAVWTADARDFFRDNRWMLEVVWLNADGTARYDVKRDAGAHPSGIAASGNPAQLARILVPITPESGGSASGQLNITLRLDTLIGNAIGETAHDYSFTVRKAGALVYSRLGEAGPPPVLAGSSVQQEIRVDGSPLLLTVWPGPAIVGRQRTFLPELTLLFGFALSTLLAVALRYGGIARLRAAGIVRAGASLEREVEERRRAEVYARTSEERARLALAEIRQILHQSRDLICTFDVAGRFLVVSASARQILGYRPEEMTGRRWQEFVFEEDHVATGDETAALQAGKATRDFENRFIHRNGGLVHLSWSAAWLPEAQTAYAIARDVTRRNRQDALREGQRSVLQLIATGADLRRVLQEICEYVERIDRSAFCSVLLLDAGERARTFVAPRLPAEYVAAVEGMRIGPSTGSCGTAMWRKEPVIVADIDTDPLWDGFRHVARAHGLRACWAMPIMGSDGRVLGSFAIYHLEPCHPRSHEVEMIESTTRLASVAIERDQIQARLLESREYLEQRVKARTRELEQSNQELEAFSYSVSHDLRAPLRAIAGFSALLQEQHGTGLDPEARRYLERIIAGTVRMSALIDDLLELGRVNRLEIMRQPLDLSALATAVSSRLQERWPRRVVEVDIAPDLVAWGDPRLLEVVFENLLDNAWKFTTDRSVAKIRIGKTVEDGQEAFFVADNGIGFDPRYAANLFGVFQRLHAGSAFPGTGVGLATVQRILQRHGGRIWAKAAVDNGASFYFTVAEQSK